MSNQTKIKSMSDTDIEYLNEYKEQYTGSLGSYTAQHIKAYRKRHPEKIKEWGKNYYDRNREEILHRRAKNRYIKRIGDGFYVAPQVRVKFGIEIV